MNQLTLTLPLTAAAFHRFSVEAKASGISLEAHLERLSLQGFGVSVADLLANVFADAPDVVSSREPLSVAA